MKKANTIFVQIASYRDPQLIPSLNDLFKNAKTPKNLRVTICWQHGPDETADIFTSAGYKLETENDLELSSKARDFPVLVFTKNGGRVNVIDIHFHKTRGACWARNTVQQLYNKEKYTLQLDSHHRFAEHWDQMLIEMTESARTKDTPKPLLTSYVSSFDPENDPQNRVREPWRMDFDRFIPEGAVFFLPATIDNWQNLDKPVRGRFYSGHFAFADGSFAVEVQHDPEYFFHGEEISIAARAYTHGYDIFHPHKIVVWHEYTRKGRVKVWDDHTTGQKLKGRVELDWVERNNICHKRNRVLFGMDGEDPNQIDFGKYGWGKVRSLHDYEEYAGISFEFRGVQQETLERSPNYHLPPNTDYHKCNTPEEWKESIIRSNDIRICIHQNELKLQETFGDQPHDFDFFYVGAHDAEGKEIFRKDLQENEIKGHLQHEWLDYRFIFTSNRKPTSYTIWTHSKSKGWLTKIDKPVTEG
jgi:Glycosyltransferase (GlcNAc)